MIVQINTDNHIQGGEELTREVESVVRSTPGRFGNRIARVEVHPSDGNSSRRAFAPGAERRHA